MTPSIRSLLHVAIDAGLVTDVSITLPDREAIDRQLAALKEQGWEVGEVKLLDAECSVGRQEWWTGFAMLWEGTRRVGITLSSQSTYIAREVAA